MEGSRVPQGDTTKSSIDSAALDTEERSSKTKELGKMFNTDLTLAQKSNDLDRATFGSTKTDSTLKTYLQASQQFVPVGEMNRLGPKVKTQDMKVSKSDHSASGQAPRPELVRGGSPAAVVLGPDMIPDLRRLRVGTARPGSRDNDRPASPLSPETAGTIQFGGTHAGSPTSQEIQAQAHAMRAQAGAERQRRRAAGDHASSVLDMLGADRGPQTHRGTQTSRLAAQLGGGPSRVRYENGLTPEERKRLHQPRPPWKRAAPGVG